MIVKKLLNTLYVTNPKAYLQKLDDTLVVRVENEKLIQLPFHLLDSIIVFSYLGCSPAVIGECSKHGISISYLDESGKFLGKYEGPISGNVLLRKAQYISAIDESKALAISKRFIAAKIHNSKGVLMRYKRDYPESCDDAFIKIIDSLSRNEKNATICETPNELRGIEGDSAHAYFSVFDKLLITNKEEIRFSSRLRRPSPDPVNAMLSFFYTILCRDIVSACESIGLDPQVGFLHKDRPGRASLALDLMEEFRSPYVDRFIVSLFNRKQIKRSDFVTSIDGAVMLKDKSRKEVLALWQQKKQEQITHPFLKEKIQIGLLPYIQAQLFSRFLRGDLEDYPAFLWR